MGSVKIAEENKFYWMHDLHVVIAQKSKKIKIGVVHRLFQNRL